MEGNEWGLDAGAGNDDDMFGPPMGASGLSANMPAPRGQPPQKTGPSETTTGSGALNPWGASPPPGAGGFPLGSSIRGLSTGPQGGPSPMGGPGGISAGPPHFGAAPTASPHFGGAPGGGPPPMGGAPMGAPPMGAPPAGPPPGAAPQGVTKAAPAVLDLSVKKGSKAEAPPAEEEGSNGWFSRLGGRLLRALPQGSRGALPLPEDRKLVHDAALGAWRYEDETAEQYRARMAEENPSAPPPPGAAPVAAAAPEPQDALSRLMAPSAPAAVLGPSSSFSAMPAFAAASTFKGSVAEPVNPKLMKKGNQGGDVQLGSASQSGPPKPDGLHPQSARNLPPQSVAQLPPQATTQLPKQGTLHLTQMQHTVQPITPLTARPLMRPEVGGTVSLEQEPRIAMPPMGAASHAAGMPGGLSNSDGYVVNSPRGPREGAPMDTTTPRAPLQALDQLCMDLSNSNLVGEANEAHELQLLGDGSGDALLHPDMSLEECVNVLGADMDDSLGLDAVGGVSATVPSVGAARMAPGGAAGRASGGTASGAQSLGAPSLGAPRGVHVVPDDKWEAELTEEWAAAGAELRAAVAAAPCVRAFLTPRLARHLQSLPVDASKPRACGVQTEGDDLHRLEAEVNAVRLAIEEERNRAAALAAELDTMRRAVEEARAHAEEARAGEQQAQDAHRSLATQLEDQQRHAAEWEAQLLHAEGVLAAKQAEAQALLTAKQAEYESMLAHRQGEYEEMLARKQAEFDEGLASRQAEYDASLASKQIEYDQGLASKQAEYDQGLASRQAEFEAHLAARQADFEEMLSNKQREYEHLVSVRDAEWQRRLDSAPPGGAIPKYEAEMQTAGERRSKPGIEVSVQTAAGTPTGAAAATPAALLAAGYGGPPMDPTPRIGHSLFPLVQGDTPESLRDGAQALVHLQDMIRAMGGAARTPSEPLPRGRTFQDLNAMFAELSGAAPDAVVDACGGAAVAGATQDPLLGELKEELGKVRRGRLQVRALCFAHALRSFARAGARALRGAPMLRAARRFFTRGGAPPAAASLALRPLALCARPARTADDAVLVELGRLSRAAAFPRRRSLQWESAHDWDSPLDEMRASVLSPNGVHTDLPLTLSMVEYRGAIKERQGHTHALVKHALLYLGLDLDVGSAPSKQRDGPIVEVNKPWEAPLGAPSVPTREWEGAAPVVPTSGWEVTAPVVGPNAAGSAHMGADPAWQAPPRVVGPPQADVVQPTMPPPPMQDWTAPPQPTNDWTPDWQQDAPVPPLQPLGVGREDVISINSHDLDTSNEMPTDGLDGQMFAGHQFQPHTPQGLDASLGGDAASPSAPMQAPVSASPLEQMPSPLELSISEPPLGGIPEMAGPMPGSVAEAPLGGVPQMPSPMQAGLGQPPLGGVPQMPSPVQSNMGASPWGDVADVPGLMHTSAATPPLGTVPHMPPHNTNAPLLGGVPHMTAAAVTKQKDVTPANTFEFSAGALSGQGNDLADILNGTPDYGYSEP